MGNFDKASYVHEAVTVSKHYTPGGLPYKKSRKKLRKYPINAFVQDLWFTWTNAFGAENVVAHIKLLKKS